MYWAKFIGTKFMTTIGCGAATTWLCYIGRIDGTIYAAVTIATVGAFIAGNVTQSIKESKYNANNTPD
jgi:hypothetical protein